MKKLAKKNSTKKIEEEPEIFKNNSAFKRAMVQMGIKHGDKITVTINSLWCR